MVGTEIMDRELIRRCAHGEESAFRELVERLEKPLLHFIHRYLGDAHAAEDLFQETMVRVLRNITDFEPEASLNTWVFTIARNLCLDRLKAKRRHREVSLDLPPLQGTGRIIDFREGIRERSEGPEGRAIQREMEVQVSRGLSRLSPAKREVLVLRVFVGVPYEEIARIVRSPVGTVKFRVHEAVRELTEMLNKNSVTGEAVGG